MVYINMYIPDLSFCVCERAIGLVDDKTLDDIHTRVCLWLSG